MDDIQEACEGLVQQRVLDTKDNNTWGLSKLGRNLVAWLSGIQENEEFERLQKVYTSRLEEGITSKIQAAIMQERRDWVQRKVQGVNA